jgi:5-methylcytosine-specific restriction endonuclease McrA
MRYKLCRCGGVRIDARGSVCNKCGAGRKVNKSQNTTERGYDGAWNRLSRRVRTEQPLCEVCLESGIVTAATEVHHKVSIEQAPWLRLERSNLMSVCNGCHKAIHATMAAPGVG